MALRWRGVEPGELLDSDSGRRLCRASHRSDDMIGTSERNMSHRSYGAGSVGIPW